MKTKRRFPVSPVTPTTSPRPVRRKQWIWSLLAVVAVGGVIAVIAVAPQTQSVENWPTRTESSSPRLRTIPLLLPDGKKLTVEVARRPTEHEIGLMFRTQLASDRGMLFVYPTEGSHTFWMKNTLIDLDIIFIGADKRVTNIADDVPRTTPETPDEHIPRRTGYGQYILEIPAGRARSLNIQVGTPLAFDL